MAKLAAYNGKCAVCDERVTADVDEIEFDEAYGTWIHVDCFEEIAETKTKMPLPMISADVKQKVFCVYYQASDGVLTLKAIYSTRQKAIDVVGKLGVVRVNLDTEARAAGHLFKEVEVL